MPLRTLCCHAGMMLARDFDDDYRRFLLHGHIDFILRDISSIYTKIRDYVCRRKDGPSRCRARPFRNLLRSDSSACVQFFVSAFADSARTSIAEFTILHQGWRSCQLKGHVSHYNVFALFLDQTDRPRIYSNFIWYWGDINNRNRYGVIVDHYLETMLVYDPNYQIVIGKAKKFLSLYLTYEEALTSKLQMEMDNSTIPMWYV